MREPGLGMVVVRSAASSLIMCPSLLLCCFARSYWQPVITFRGFRRYDAFRHVLLYQRRRTRTRIAEASTACQSHFNDLIGARERDQLAGFAIVHHVAIGIEHHAAHAATWQATMQPLHR